MDEIRINVRELMRYIEKEIIEPIISDFDDKIDKTKDADDDEVDFNVTTDDFKTFKEKVEYYINHNHSASLVYQVNNFMKITNEAVEEFKNEIRKLAKDENEYIDLFKSDADISAYVRKNCGISKDAIDAFIKNESTKGYSERQLNYIFELLKFISQNGKFEKNDLLREELHFSDLFNSSEINTIINEIKERL